MNASTHDAIFVVTCGKHFKPDDMFKVVELSAKLAKIKEWKLSKNYS